MFVSYMYSKSALGVLSSLVSSNALIQTLIFATFLAVLLVPPKRANILSYAPEPFLLGTLRLSP